MKLGISHSLVAFAVSSALPLTVKAQPNQENQIEKVEVIGHKLSLVNQDVAASVSILGSEEIQRNQESELTNLLRELPGVEMNGSVSPLSGQPAIRGLYGERIHISVDNVKRKTESDGSSNIATINSLGVDPAQLKLVQVLRGADSLTVGSGAVGGSIRMVTKDAADYLNHQDGLGVRLSSAYQGASDAVTLGASSFSLNGNLDTVFNVSRVDFSDVDIVGDRQIGGEGIPALEKIRNDSSRSNVSLKSTWQIGPVHRLKGKVDWSETESKDQPYSQRMDLALAYPTLKENYQNDYLEGSLLYSYQPDSHWVDLDIHATFSEKNMEKQTRGYIPRGENRISYDADNNWSNKRKGLRLSNLSIVQAAVEHKVALELNYEREDFSQKQWDLSTAENKLTSFYGNSNATNVSVSLIDQVELFSQRLLLTAGGRYDSYKRDNSLFASYAGNDDGEFSSEVGLTFRATDNLNFYLKRAEAFRAPSVQELYKKDEWRCHIGGKICYQEPQPDLKPETSDNLEAGFGLHWTDTAYADQFGFKFIYFDNEINNYIDNVPFMYYFDSEGNKQLGSPGPEPANGVPVATHRDYSAKNISQLKNRGIEVEIDYRLGALSAYLGYSTINMDVFGVPNFFLGTVEQQWQPYSEAPADKMTLNLNYQLRPDLNIGGQMLAYGKQDRLSQLYLENGYGTESYRVFNLNLSYQGLGVFEGVTLVAGVDNLTNERYLRAPASEARDPAEVGRNYKVSLYYQF
ncbi:TonB-dependent heme/hemoglobin receptor ChuA/ShuA [Bowmanella denitrificans]|uniref:TonB-dependent heme/hemoglobin receptor ChuA/ShuA n=1 Tax=Bowmanella denitrificans TaxID=366582 RepID=A0ABN0X6P4_9ALTE